MLETLYHENREEFWKLLKSLKTNVKEEGLPTIENLMEHFKNLYSIKSDNKSSCKSICLRYGKHENFRLFKQ